MNSLEEANKYFDEGSYQKAFELYEESWFSSGSQETLVQICWMLFSGLGVKKNQSLAISRLENEESKSSGIIFAIASMMYRKRNYKDAYEWFEKSANLGSSRALLFLGILSEMKEEYGDSKVYYSRGVGMGSISCEYQMVKLNIKVNNSILCRVKYEIKRFIVLFKILILFLRDVSDERLYDIYSEKKILKASHILNRRHP